MENPAEPTEQAIERWRARLKEADNESVPYDKRMEIMLEVSTAALVDGDSAAVSALFERIQRDLDNQSSADLTPD